jgi:hypothetical protein
MTAHTAAEAWDVSCVCTVEQLVYITHPEKLEARSQRAFICKRAHARARRHGGHEIAPVREVSTIVGVVRIVGEKRKPVLQLHCILRFQESFYVLISQHRTENVFGMATAIDFDEVADAEEEFRDARALFKTAKEQATASPTDPVLSAKRALAEAKLDKAKAEMAWIEAGKPKPSQEYDLFLTTSKTVTAAQEHYSRVSSEGGPGAF